MTDHAATRVVIVCDTGVDDAMAIFSRFTLIIGMDGQGPEPISPEATQAAETAGCLAAERGGILVSGGRGGSRRATGNAQPPDDPRK